MALPPFPSVTLVIRVPATLDRHAALLITNCIEAFILYMPMLGFVTIVWHVPGTLLQYYAENDLYDDATSGCCSTSASDDSMRTSHASLHLFSCA